MLIHPKDRPLAGTPGQEKESEGDRASTLRRTRALRGAYGLQAPPDPGSARLAPRSARSRGAGLPAVPQTHRAHSDLKAFAPSGPSAQSPLPQSFTRLPPPLRSLTSSVTSPDRPPPQPGLSRNPVLVAQPSRCSFPSKHIPLRTCIARGECVWGSPPNLRCLEHDYVQYGSRSQRLVLATGLHPQ